MNNILDHVIIEEEDALLNVLFEQCDLYLKEFQQSIYLEATVSKDDQKNTREPIGARIKNAFINIIKWIKRAFQRFANWVKNVAHKFVSLFKKSHNKQEDDVKEDQTIIDKISIGLKNGSFNPQIKNWPNYKLCTDKMENMKLQKLVKLGFEQKTKSVDELSRLYLPPFIFNNIQKTQSRNLTEAYYYGEAVNYHQNDPIKSSVKPIYVCFETIRPTETELRNVVFKKKGDNRSMYARGDDFVWDTIAKVTKSKMQHVGIALDPSLKETFSYHPESPNTKPYHDKGGFRIQDFIKEYGEENKEGPSGLTVYVGFVDNKHYKMIEDYINLHKKNLDKSKYNWNEIFLRFMKRQNEVSDNDFAWVCSTFTNAVLTKAGAKLAEIRDEPSPGDLGRAVVKQSNFECVYAGPVIGYDVDKVKQRTSKFAQGQYTTTIHDNTDIIGANIQRLYKSGDAFVDAMVDYFLYDGGRIQEKVLDHLTPEAWNNLIFNILQTTKGFESRLKEIVEDNDRTTSFLKIKIEELENKIFELTNSTASKSVDIEKEYQPLRDDLNKARVYLQFTNNMSVKYNAGYNRIMSHDFYNVSYNLYKQTVQVFKNTMT